MKIIEIDGIKYSLTPIEDESKEQTLHDLIVDWVDDDNTPPVKVLIERIKQWLPEEAVIEPGGDEWDIAWNIGHNTYRNQLISKLK
jgi:hypothetical protein